MPDTKEFKQLLDWTSTVHRPWKQRSFTSDLITQGKWQLVWPDLTVEERDPLVENAYLEALEDKAGAAASINPFVTVPPIRGTQNDRAEENAQKKRRIFLAMMQGSNEVDHRIGFYEDWLMHGGTWAHPWKDWRQPGPHLPYFVRVDPRYVFPIAHNSKGELSAGMVRKMRRESDLLHDYGVDNKGLNSLLTRLRASTDNKEPGLIEEVWWFTEEEWGVAVVGTTRPSRYDYFRYVAPTETESTSQIEWVIPPEPHRLEGCPLVEKKRRAPDGEYRGALDGMIPNLKVAHNLMARLLADVEKTTFAPVILENIENYEDFGPGAHLIGTGQGARVEYARPPMNFETFQQAQYQVEQAKNSGKYPKQRSGDFGASIASAKATASIMGAFNVEQAWAQQDMTAFYQRLLERTANFDAVWCPGSKQITGLDQGEMFTDTYDSTTFWKGRNDKGDYRVFVGFHAMGIDQQQLITQLAMARNLGALPRRAFMLKSGMSDNPLADEREIALEISDEAFLALIQNQAAQGNPEPLQIFRRFIDSDKETVRSAVSKTVEQMFTVPEGGGPGGQPGGPGNPGQVLRAAQSLEAGGIPGNAEAQGPQIREGLASLLPPNIRGPAREGLPA